MINFMLKEVGLVLAAVISWRREVRRFGRSKVCEIICIAMGIAFALSFGQSAPVDRKAWRHLHPK